MHKSRKKSQDAPCSACDFTLLIFPPANSEVCCSTADEVKHQGAQLFSCSQSKLHRKAHTVGLSQMRPAVAVMRVDTSHASAYFNRPRGRTSLHRHDALYTQKNRIGMMRYIRKKTAASAAVFCVGIDLSSRSVSRQVLSALVSLTSVFGMGTGGPSPLKTPTI